MGLNWDVIGLTLGGLFCFGLAYAAFVRSLARRGHDGQTAYLVAVGVGVTVLASAAMIGPVNTALMLAAFAASGSPMIIEYVHRVLEAQKADRENSRDLARKIAEWLPREQ